MSSMKIFEGGYVIYGIFDSAGRCHYVGQSVNHERRASIHFSSSTSPFKGSAWTLRVLRQCTRGQADRLETQIGTAYHRRGQAEYSKVFGFSANRRLASPIIYIEGVPFAFCGYSSAKRFIGCLSTETVMRHISDGYTTIFGEKRLISTHPIEFTYEI